MKGKKNMIMEESLVKNKKMDDVKNLIITKIKELSSNKIDCNVDVDGDEGDAAQGTLILHMAYEHSDRNNAKLIALYEALKKIEKKEYGICEECECEIEKKRLLICPETKYCIRCMEMIERENKLYRQ